MEAMIDKLRTLAVEQGIGILTNIVLAILIFLVGRWIAKLIKQLSMKLLQKAKVDDTLAKFAANMIHVTLLIFVIVAALDKLGVETASVIAALGAAAFAVGLALQGSLANFAAGVLMIIFRPIKVGDFIEGAGATGTVEEIGIFNTELKSPDNKLIIVPNAKITGDNIVNYTARENRRVDMIIGVGYEDDLDKVRAILKDIATSDDRVLKDPEPMIEVKEMADSSVNFVFRPWVKTEDYWDVYFAMQETVKKRFDKEGVSIPFPQRDVHLFKSE